MGPWWVNILVNRLDVLLGDYAQWLWWNPTKESEVVAFNAKTGTPEWRYKIPRPYRRMGSHGIDHGAEGMMQLNNPRWEQTASWGSPFIDGSGTVYGCHMSGYAYNIRDTNGDGIIDTETETFERYVGASCLHGGYAIGKGMMGFSTLWTTW